MKFGNLKIIGDQIRETLNQVDKPDNQNICEMRKLSIIVDSGACDNVIDPRELFGYLFTGINGSKQGNISFTDSGGPIPHLGEKESNSVH